MVLVFNETDTAVVVVWVRSDAFIDRRRVIFK